MMKSKVLIALMGTLTMMSLLCTTSCQKEPSTKEATLVLNIASEYIAATRSTEAQGAEADSKVNRLDIFVFNSDGELDIHRAIDNPSTLTGITVQAIEGANKAIYVVANANAINGDASIRRWMGITSKAALESAFINLSKEELADFLMVGSTTAHLMGTTPVTVNIARRVARIILSSVTTDFSGTAYEGTALTNVKAYLINVIGQKTLVNESYPLSNPLILNRGGNNPADGSACAIQGALFDNIGTLQANTPHATPHYFYAYQNLINNENTLKFTRLVVEATFPSGKTYYYPININQIGFKAASNPNHDGIQSNTIYSYSVVIKRPGTTDPEIPITYADASLSVVVTPWVTVENVQTVF